MRNASHIVSTGLLNLFYGSDELRILFLNTLVNNTQHCYSVIIIICELIAVRSTMRDDYKNDFINSSISGYNSIGQFSMMRLRIEYATSSATRDFN